MTPNPSVILFWQPGHYPACGRGLREFFGDFNADPLRRSHTIFSTYRTTCVGLFCRAPYALD